MKKHILSILAIILIISCNEKGESEMESLNKSSKECIQIANKAEADAAAAYAAGDADLAAIHKATMDSALKENVLIGIKMSELEK